MALVDKDSFWHCVNVPRDFVSSFTIGGVWKVNLMVSASSGGLSLADCHAFKAFGIVVIVINLCCLLSPTIRGLSNVPELEPLNSECSLERVPTFFFLFQEIQKNCAGPCVVLFEATCVFPVWSQCQTVCHNK